ncbi:hypothetical protein [Streptomyces sp. B6B3]|uniref:hypothetical protein n=1 Tax=Streptomyces sp. B6B3 TaxID=3153570 RepID=UPI00325E105F
MNAHGTIGRPAAHGPDDTGTTLVHPPTTEHTGAPRAEPAAATPRRKQNRNSTLHLIQEALARSHMEERVRTAEAERRAHRLAIADRLERRSRRLQSRAERASLRARRALARAITL